MQSPTVSPTKLKERETRIAAELIKISLWILNPQKTSDVLSINSYPEKFYS
jgi:hypothetical protein